MNKEKYVYVWDSSIPERWKKIAGKDHFIHISKSNKAKNTLEFLTETQKYIHYIRNSKIHSLMKDGTSQRRNTKYSSVRAFKKKGFEDRTPKTLIYSQGEVQGTSFPSMSNFEENKIILPKLPDMKNPSNRNLSAISKSISSDSLLKKNNSKLQYIKLNSQKKPEFIYLPKALQAHQARIMKNFSPEGYL